eukprot:gene4705-9325_t
MADFIDDNVDAEDDTADLETIPEKSSNEQELGQESGEIETNSSLLKKSEVAQIGVSPIYCPICSCPPEYCEYGPTYDQCLPWILQNCPDILNPDVLSKALGNTSLEDTEGKDDGADEKKKKKRGGSSVPKKVAVVETKIIISRVQRQKRKFVTSVVGLDTVPDLKLKDAAKVFGKKFSSGASIGDTATGGKEIVIQGDVSFDLPALLVSEFKIPKSAIFIIDEGVTRPYEG